MYLRRPEASLTNTASVTASGEINLANNSALDTVMITGTPDLGITKSHTGNFSQGRVGATYSLAVSNLGGAATSATVTVLDTMPTGLTPTAGAGTGWSCSVAGQTITCTRGDTLAAGAAYPAITLTATVAGNAPATLSNTATVSVTGDSNPANNSATDVATVATVSDLTLTMVVPTTTVPGGSGTYTFTATNAGGAATSGTVTVTDTFPVSVTPGSATGTGWTCTTSGQMVSCTRGDALSAAGSYPALSVRYFCGDCIGLHRQHGHRKRRE